MTTTPSIDNVVPGEFYEAPVAWAVAREITTGMSATYFGANTGCNRTQIVTFLYWAFCE